MAVTNLDRAKVSILTQHPFFASILMKRKLIEDNTIPTAAVDQRGQIYYNKDFVESKSVAELVFLLCHEVGHVIGQHSSRRGARQAKKWNIAGDAWINDMLKDAGVGEFIDGGVDMPGSKDRTVDDIYNSLPDAPDGDGPGGIGDDIIERGAPLDAAEAEQLDAEMRVEIAQAAQVAKQKDKLPAAMHRIVEELIATRTPWYDVLERYMVSHTKADYTWARRNRRFADVYLPSVGKRAQMGDVVVQVDVSGSVSQHEINHYNGHLARIVELCSPERVHILYTDVAVCKHDVFVDGETPVIGMYSGGGTDMEAGFRYLDKEGIEPDVFVCLTDGYTDFTASSKPAYPVVWCISTDIVAPYGDTIHFTLE